MSSGDSKFIRSSLRGVFDERFALLLVGGGGGSRREEEEVTAVCWPAGHSNSWPNG